MPNSPSLTLDGHLPDPFNAQDSDIAEPAVVLRESLKSFWIGCSGLAMFALMASVGAISSGNLDDLLVLQVFGIENGAQNWVATYGIQVTLLKTLVPSIVIGALVPLLYWRGSLAQRFSLSVVLAITTMNLSFNAETSDSRR